MDAAGGKIDLQGHRQIRLVIGLLVCGLVLSSGCKLAERRILYSPDRYSKRLWTEPEKDELSGLQFEDVQFKSVDGTPLHGWFVQPDGIQPKSVILFAHGRNGNVSDLKSNLLEFSRRYQAAVFAFDYRGFGKSEGRPSEQGLYDDTLSARDWLARKMGMRADEVVLMGHSLGGGAVIDVASRFGAKALIVESSFTSIPNVLNHYSRGLLKGRWLESDYNSVSKIGSYTGPVFISHGTEDKAIPFDHGVRLANSAKKASRVVFVEFKGRHKTERDKEYQEKLGSFLESVYR